MSDINITYESGYTLFFVIRNMVGKVYNSNTELFETWDDDNLSYYKFELIDSSDFYYHQWDFPSLPSANYMIQFYKDSTPDILLHSVQISWDGDTLSYVVGSKSTIELTYTTGYSLYFILRDRYGLVLNKVTNIMETYNVANIENYKIDLTEINGLYIYSETLPILDNGYYEIQIYKDDILVTSFQLLYDGSQSYELNSYASISYADNLLYLRLNKEAWQSATQLEKAKALNEATIQINNLNYWGNKTDSTQDFEFPRDGETTYPTNIVNACCLEACARLASNIDEERNSDKIASQKYGGMEVVYRNTIRENISSGILSTEAWDLIKPFLRCHDVVNLTRVN